MSQACTFIFKFFINLAQQKGAQNKNLKVKDLPSSAHPCNHQSDLEKEYSQSPVSVYSWAPNTPPVVLPSIYARIVNTIVSSPAFQTLHRQNHLVFALFSFIYITMAKSIRAEDYC